ncbi:MAG: YihA family ribosome biogenesis GTP-binding protein [Acidobacteria bacterium]|jgi:GTP-binding protein|nr:MAG: YihA family ribosome biogenesis GTP-binding protein [Acidobacteriota bacterium]GIU83031.1 MAG: putative GTP-binding protein EngB [Pyrinomonadaceae bacterium]
MKISSVSFVKSAFDRKGWVNDHKPEIAFLGRSNVGKSSLINLLLGKRNLAKVSKTPGRTQSINFFLINDEFYFVDLPGYGFAKVPKKIYQSWGDMIEDYLRNREQLKLCIQLIDARHEPSELDKKLWDWLTFYQKKHVLIATKVDKLSANQLQISLSRIREIFPGSKIIASSSVTGEGKENIWKEIKAVVET